MQLIPTKDLERAEWLKIRQSGIGGSDIAAIMGVSKYKTPYDLYLEKIGDPDLNSSPAGEAAHWGTVMEDVLAKEYSARNDVQIQRFNFMMRSDKYPFAIANIDRAVINPDIAKRVTYKDGALNTDKLLEIKTASEYLKGEWGIDGSDEIPEYYVTQCQWYMGITNVPTCDLAVLIGGNQYKQYTIHFDKELFDIMIAEAQDFWENHVLAGVPPEAVTLKNAKHRWRKVDPDSIFEVTEDEHVELIAEILEAKEVIKQKEAELELLQAKLINVIQEKEVIQLDGETIATYKMQKGRATFDKKGFFKDHPELAHLQDTYSKVSEPTRVFKFKKS